MSVLPLGRSVYLSQPETVEAALAREDTREVPLFLSLHISEEMNEAYCANARQVCRKLAEKGYQIIADVSVKTCAVFHQPDLALLARELGLYALRVDYGLETEEICALAGQLPVAVNASTVSLSDAERIARAGIAHSYTSLQSAQVASPLAFTHLRIGQMKPQNGVFTPSERQPVQFIISGVISALFSLLQSSAVLRRSSSSLFNVASLASHFSQFSPQQPISSFVISVLLF